MKKLFLFFVVCLCLVSGSKSAYQKKHATKAHIEFKEGQHDFGEVIFGHPASWNFEFKNTGVDTLQITEVQSTCGCTVPNWSKEPIPPQQSGEITITYDAQRSGFFQKGVTVFSNADNSALVLVITGTVTTNPHKIIIGGKSEQKQINQIETQEPSVMMDDSEIKTELQLAPNAQPIEK